MVFALFVLAAACGGSNHAPSKASEKATVLAAASLTESFNQISGATFSFAGSQALVTQLQEGSPADVIALADEPHMQTLVKAHLVDTPVVFARNTLEVVVAPGNPKHVKGLADLARDDVTVVLADPSVPVGSYSRQVLQRAGVAAHPRSLELDVKAVLAKVTSGEADAAIVYASDAHAAGAKALGIVIPRQDNVIATYPIAVVRASKHRAAANAFIRRVLSTDGQRALRANGFLSAS